MSESAKTGWVYIYRFGANLVRVYRCWVYDVGQNNSEVMTIEYNAPRHCRKDAPVTWYRDRTKVNVKEGVPRDGGSVLTVWYSKRNDTKALAALRTGVDAKLAKQFTKLYLDLDRAKETQRLWDTWEIDVSDRTESFK